MSECSCCSLILINKHKLIYCYLPIQHNLNRESFAHVKLGWIYLLIHATLQVQDIDVSSPFLLFSGTVIIQIK